MGRDRRARLGTLGLGGRDHVVLGQPPVLAGAPNLARVDMIFEHGATHRGRERRDMVLLALDDFRLGHRRRLVAAQRGGLARPRRVGARLRGRRGGRRRGSRPGFVDAGNDCPDRDRVAFLHELLGEHSRRGRWHFHRHLVGLEAGDRLIFRNGLAGLLQPLGERPFGDRFPERGDLDVGCHGVPLFRRDGGACGAAAMTERRRNQGRLFRRMALGEPRRR